MQILKRIILFITLLTTLVLTGCAGTQEINQKSALSYSQAVGEMQQKGVIDNTSVTAKRIHHVFNHMKPYAEKANKTGVPFAWQITVMKNDELNAWAMPGGKMMFYTGLVDRLKLSDNEIAIVMGHEMAHAIKEHGKQKVNFQTATGIAGAIGSIAITAVTGVDMSDMVGLTEEFALNRPFSRSNETEADEVGLLLAAESGYNPEVAPGVWDKMAKATGGSGGMLSTHPSDEDRKENLQELMPEAIVVYNQSNKVN